MLTRAADYAVRVMVHLATLPSGSRLQKAALAEATGVPDSFLSKVLQSLVRASLITSRTGSNGGFELIASAEDITVLDVVEAIDGPVGLNICVAGGQRCERQNFCAAHFVWLEAQEAVTRALRSATIARLATRQGCPVLSEAKGGEVMDDDKILLRSHCSSDDRALI